MDQKPEELEEMMNTARAEANKDMAHKTIHRRFTMKRFIIAVMFAAMAGVSLSFVTPVKALDYDYAGIMRFHNEVALNKFTITETSNVTVFSSSWDDGGFDPILGLWNSTGTLIQIQDDNGFAGSTLSNGISYDYGVFDSHFTNTLTAGIYTVSLTRYPNFNNSALLSNGFNFDSQTPTLFYSGTIPNYAFHVVATTAVPEPASLMLLGAGLAAIGIWRRKAAR